MYVVFEGIDTCGKTTQIELLKPKFPDAIFTREPGGSIIGGKIREMVLGEGRLDSRAQFLLFLADRAQHCAEVIKPHRDKLIIADRSLISGIAYAEGVESMQQAKAYNLFAMGGILPHKVVLFRTTRELLAQRLDGKEADAIEQKGIDYLLEIQERLFDITEDLEGLGVECLRLDASEDRESLHQKILAFL